MEATEPPQPPLKGDYAGFLARGDLDAYTHQLMEDGLGWWFNMDIPAIATHLHPLKDFPASDIPPPSRLAFLLEAVGPEISEEAMADIYERMLAENDWEGACAAAGAGTGAVWDSGFDFRRFSPWLERIEHLLAHSDRIPPLARASLLGFKGNAEINGLGDLRLAREPCRQQILAAEEAQSVSLRLFHAALQTYCDLWNGELTAAGVLLQDASYFCDHEDATLIDVVFFQSSFGLYHTIAGDPEIGRSILEDITSAPSFDLMPPSVWLLVNANLLFATANCQDRTPLDTIADRIRQYAIPQQNAFHQSYAHFSLGVAALALGDPNRALVHAREATARGLVSHSPVTARMPALLEGQALADLGHHREALAHFEHWMETWLSTGFCTLAVTASLEAAVMLASEGRMDEARVWYERAVDAMPPGEPLPMFHRPRKVVQELEARLFATEMSATDDLSPPVRIHCLGELRIEVGDRVIYDRKWRGGRTKTLLKALIVHGGSKISAALLADLLWPDSSGDQARQNLKVALWRLRRLGLDKKATPAPWLQVRHGHISMIRSLCKVDALLFEERLNEALTVRETDPDKLKEALSMYAGDFLGADDSETWITEHREHLRARFLRGVLTLAALPGNRKDAEDALGFLLRATEIDPLDERIYEQTMQTYLRLGYPSKALQTYHHAQEALRHGLGIKPGPTLTTLAQEAGAHES